MIFLAPHVKFILCFLVIKLVHVHWKNYIKTQWRKQIWSVLQPPRDRHYQHFRIHPSGLFPNHLLCDTCTCTINTIRTSLRHYFVTCTPQYRSTIYSSVYCKHFLLWLNVLHHGFSRFLVYYHLDSFFITKRLLHFNCFC